MPSVSHTKRKEHIALALRIKSSARPGKTCSFYTKRSRSCWLDLTLSSRYSEYVRSKRHYDSEGYPESSIPSVRKPICRFFFGPRRRRLPTPPSSPRPEPSWLPSFELEDLLDQALREDGEFWADMDFYSGTPQASQSS
jgi:hypothetical protein